MKTLVVYFSSHHLNTLKLVDFLNEKKEFDKIELKESEELPKINLDNYDRIIFASGVYYGKLAKEIYEFAKVYRESLVNKDIFTLVTAGLESVDYAKDFEDEMKKMGISVKDKFQCRGYCTYGPLKLIGGFSKNHPNQEDYDNLIDFYNNL